MNTGENYASIVGANRFDTVIHLYKKLGYKALAKAVVQGILNKAINTDNTNVINANNTTTTKYKNCILYGNDIDKVSAEILSWAKNDCIAKHVKDHIAWEGTNLFVVGGAAKNELEKMNTGENYASIVGANRFDTVIQANDERGNGNTTGVEVLVYKLGGEAEKVSKRVVNQIAKLNLKNRGVKVRNNLAFLKNTKATSLLIECCFVDDKDDVNAYNYKTMAKAIVEGILNKTINTDNTSSTNNTKYTNCILYGNDIDKVSAEILSWAKSDCIIKNVKDHIAWEGTNLFVVGGPAKNEFEKMNTGENYTSIIGANRYDTVIQVLKNIGKL